MKFGGTERVCLLVIIIALIASFSEGKGSTERGGRVKRVWNGTDAQYGEYPYTARVRRSNYPICTGVLISELAALTAQHCIRERTYIKSRKIYGKPYTLLLGIVEVGQPATIVKIKEVHLPETKHIDIAILNFGKPVKLSEIIKPAALSEKPFIYKEDTQVDFSGWGVSFNPVKKRLLKYHRMIIVKNKVCGLIYGGDFTEPFRVCTQHYVDGICSRRGDSGGPLVIKRSEGDVLVGVLTAFGACIKGNPEIFASVSWNAVWIRRYAEGNLTFVEVKDT